MNRLVFMAVGGSGERVFTSFMMALTAGMHVDADSVLPIIIDNDAESHALTECKNLINYYRKEGSVNSPKMGANAIYGKAFGQDREKWPSFFETVIEEPIYLDSDGAHIGNLRKVIGSLDESLNDINEERDLLFTDKDLDMPLDGGFIGNPNIGSVVLNAIALHDGRYSSKHSEISRDDGLVVVGSLFGGTGAAGIPLIVNKFKEKGGNCPRIGVISLLPYFTTFSDDKFAAAGKWDVYSDMFDVKTRAALMYYADYMQDVDVQYYVGDRACKAVYKHQIFGDKQNNSTHPIEVMAALCAIDFSKSHFEDSVVYKRPVWSFSDGSDPLSSNLSDAPNTEFKKAIVKFQMFKWMMTSDDLLKERINEKSPFVEYIGFNESMRQAVVSNNEQKISQFPYAWGVNKLFHCWDEWIKALTNPKNVVASKRKMSFFKDGVINEENITQMFYTDNEHGWGIANTIQIRDGLFKHRPAPQPSELNNILIKSYDNLVKAKVIPNKDTVIEDENKLPYLLRILSDALDTVIKDKCSL